jgi:hypothetical protein
MPTVKKKIPRYKKFFVNDVLPAPIIRFLKTGERPGPEDERGLECFLICIDDEKIKAIWDEYKAAILKQWIAESPCTRPWAWWEWDSPRDESLMKQWRNRTFPIVRLQIVGEGMTNQERYPGTLPTFHKGIPDSWHGIDNNNPPMFEAEASYLKRYNFLSKEEERLLTESDYKPESISEIIGV